MKKLLLLLLLPASLMLISSCRKTPVACISADKKEALVSESIAFTSCATDAKRTVWDFGDGSEKTEGETVSHTYTKEGVYLVTATAYSKKDKKADKISTLITVNAPPPVKDRFLTKIVLVDFPSKNETGSDWDDGSFGQSIEPEIFVLLKLTSGSSWQLRTSSIESATSNELPYTWDYTPQNIFLANEDWIVEMNEDDGFGGFGTYELMADWNSNLATVDAMNNVITLTNTSNPSGSAVIELHFSER